MAQNTPAASLSTLTDVWGPHVSFSFNLLPPSTFSCSPLHPPRHERRRHAPPPGEPPPPAAEPLPRLALRGHAVAGAPRAGTPPPRPQASSHPLLRSHAALAAAAPLRAWSGEAVPLRFGSPLPCTPAMAPHGRRCYRLPCATPRGRPERSSTPLRAPPLVHLRVAAGPSGAGEGGARPAARLAAAASSAASSAARSAVPAATRSAHGRSRGGPHPLGLLDRPRSSPVRCGMQGSEAAGDAGVWAAGDAREEARRRRGARGGEPAQLASSRGVGKPARGRGGGLPARSQAGEELALGGAGRQRREELAGEGGEGGGEQAAASGGGGLK